MGELVARSPAPMFEVGERWMAEDFRLTGGWYRRDVRHSVRGAGGESLSGRRAQGPAREFLLMIDKRFCRPDRQEMVRMRCCFRRFPRCRPFRNFGTCTNGWPGIVVAWTGRALLGAHGRAHCAVNRRTLPVTRLLSMLVNNDESQEPQFLPDRDRDRTACHCCNITLALYASDVLVVTLPRPCVPYSRYWC